MIKLNKLNNFLNKKYKLYKSVVALSLATTTFLSSCGINKEVNYNNSESNDSYYQNDITQTPSYNNLQTNQNIYNNFNEQLLSDSEFKKVILSNINLSDVYLEEFINYITNIEVYYPNSNFFYIDENLIKYNNKKDYVSSSDNDLKSNMISGETIYNIVLKNNSNENFMDNAKISDTDLKEICNKIAETIDYVIKNNEIDLILLNQKVKTLKIRNFTGFSNGSYDATTGVMWLDVSKLKSDKKLLKNVISHETIHLVQACSLNELKESDYKSRLGCSYRFSDLIVNSLDWDWFIEGTAEVMMMKENSLDFALTYDNLIRIIETVKYSTILNPDNGVDDFESLSFESDLNNLFKYFDSKTNEEKSEIIKMMFSYELISGLTGSESLKEFYSETKLDLSERRVYEKQIKSSISQTLTKQFYKNLALNMQNKNVTMNEIFELITIFESEMNKLTWYSAEYNKGNIDEFLVNYVDIQNKFFNMVSINTNLELEDIKNSYEIYNNNRYNDLSVVTSLDISKKEFVSDVKENRKNDRTRSIRYFYEIVKTNLKQK